MCYVLDLLVRAMIVGNYVFFCLYGLSVYFEVPISFGDWYLSQPCRLTKID